MRALKKSQDERKIKEQKEAEIAELKESFGKLGIKKSKQSQALETNLWFQHYLESVLEHGEEFSEIKDLITRYDTLAATNAELVERALMAQEKTEEFRQHFANSSEVRLSNLGTKQRCSKLQQRNRSTAV